MSYIGRIPDGVTFIGEAAFAFCRKPESIIIPDGVTSIGEFVFDHCPNLVIHISPDCYRRFPQHIFDGCKYVDISSPANGQPF